MIPVSMIYTEQQHVQNMFCTITCCTIKLSFYDFIHSHSSHFVANATNYLDAANAVVCCYCVNEGAAVIDEQSFKSVTGVFPGANRSAANSELLTASPTELIFTPQTKQHLDTTQRQRVFGEEQEQQRKTRVCVYNKLCRVIF